MDQIKLDPPIIIIEIFDQDQVGKSEFIGRAMAKPIVKSLEDPYAKPLFPPSLDWYEITRGLNHAGELLATFELLEISREENGEPGQPPMVLSLPTPIEGTDIISVPEEIRPTLAGYRIEIMFWGLRDLKRVHFLTVDKPRVDVECAGNILYSSVINNAKKTSNFVCSGKFFFVELPEQQLYRPPLTIRVVDCRSFGRFTLVGTHTINSIHDYMYTFQTAKEMEAEERRKSLMHGCDILDFGLNETKIQIEKEKDNCPSLFRDTPLIYGTNIDTKGAKSKTMKMKNYGDDEDDDEDISKDWWTKYFASVETFIQEGKEAKLKQNSSTLYSEGEGDFSTIGHHAFEDDNINKLKAIPSTSKAFPSTSQAIPSTSKAFPSTSKAIPGTSKAYPGIAKAIPATEKPMRTPSKAFLNSSNPIQTTKKSYPGTAKAMPSTSKAGKSFSPLHKAKTGPKTALCKVRTMIL